jgi:hypothetical protein
MTRTNDIELRRLLAVSKPDFAAAKERKMARVREAISWPSGTSQVNKAYQTVWPGSQYEVRLGKPGKEAEEGYALCRYKDGHKGNNPNDMWPCIWDGKRIIEKSATFIDVFDELQALIRTDPHCLELIGCLLFRSAFMIDHIDEGGGRWRYHPPQRVVEIISGYAPSAFGVPMEAFLHYLDALAWNEDVKYYTLGYDITRGGTGRENNLLTCVNIIGVFLDKIPLSKFAGAFARPPVGISAISRKKALETFSLLNPV